MGGSSSKNVEKNMMIDIFNKSVFNSINKNTTECQNDLSSDQTINIKSKATKEQQKIFQENRLKCLELFQDRSPEELKELCPSAMVNVSDISQDMVISFKGKCELNAEQINQIKNDIASEVSQNFKEEKDALTGALSDMVSAFAISDSDSNEETNIEQTVKNIVETNVTNENLTKTVSDFSVSQTLNFEGDGGTLDASGISQKASYSIVMGNITKQLAKNVSDTVLENKVKQETESKEKGVTDIAEAGIGATRQAVGAVVGGLLGNNEDSEDDGLLGSIVFYVVGLIVFIIIFGTIIYFATRNKQNNEPAQTGSGESRYLFPIKLNKKIRINIINVFLFIISLLFVYYCIRNKNS